VTGDPGERTSEARSRDVDVGVFVAVGFLVGWLVTSVWRRRE
jgi:hypothetical protein